MDRTPEVVILPVSDIDRAVESEEKPLIPVEHRGRFGSPRD